MAEMIREAFALALEALPVALPLAIALWLIAVVLCRHLAKRKAPWVFLLFACGYLALLLYGTCLSRIESLADFFAWQKDPQSGLDFQFAAGDMASAKHFAMNVLLFLPWGLLGTLRLKKSVGLLVCLASGLLMSAGIEAFQLYHGMSFDLSDVAANGIGTIVGEVLVLPLFFYRKYKRAA